MRFHAPATVTIYHDGFTQKVRPLGTEDADDSDTEYVRVDAVEKAVRRTCESHGKPPDISVTHWRFNTNQAVAAVMAELRKGAE